MSKTLSVVELCVMHLLSGFVIHHELVNSYDFLMKKKKVIENISYIEAICFSEIPDCVIQSI